MNQAPDLNAGVMLLLSDGSVMAKTLTDGMGDTTGNIWNKLTPDANGSYVNGTWSAISPMHDTRYYFASQMLMDGRIYVGGGEYGTGISSSEIYDPVSDNWTITSTVGFDISDGSSEILPDGRILQSYETPVGNYKKTGIYDPSNNTFIHGPSTLHAFSEASWVKLPDNSILFVDFSAQTSERYIPSQNRWIADAHVPVQLYDWEIREVGAALLLPDGRAFFLGGTGHTAYYTPSGDTSVGVWSAGPDIPDLNAATDAAAAMMMNGKILCAFSPYPTAYDQFPSPTFFYEFDYLTDSFSAITAPDGSDYIYEPCFLTNMLDLPDGNILYADQASSQYYIYQPDGVPVASGKPTIGVINQTSCNSYSITGTLFNGISEGAAYGDDWQMATNYPIVQLTNGNNVYYCRTTNWNSTGIQRGNSPDTTQFTLPVSLPLTNYSLAVIANGIRSNPVSFTPVLCSQIGETQNSELNRFLVYPNPASETVTVGFNAPKEGKYSVQLVDVSGRRIIEETDEARAGDNFHTINLHRIEAGIYTTIVKMKDAEYKAKLIVK